MDSINGSCGKYNQRFSTESKQNGWRHFSPLKCINTPQRLRWDKVIVFSYTLNTFKRFTRKTTEYSLQNQDNQSWRPFSPLKLYQCTTKGVTMRAIEYSVRNRDKLGVIFSSYTLNTLQRFGEWKTESNSTKPRHLKLASFFSSHTVSIHYKGCDESDRIFGTKPI